MNKFLVSAALVAALATSQAATAASLSGVTGSVMVNQGEGFVPAADSLELNVGDKVYVGEGGFASVSYGDCAVALDKPTVHSVAKVAPCAGAVITPTADLVDAPAFPLLPLLLVGGAAAAVAIIVIANEDDNAS